MTLRELLKNKTLPVSIVAPAHCSGIVKIVYFDNDYCFGYDQYQPMSFSLSISAELYQEPRPKKKMYAYLEIPHRDSGYILKYYGENDFIITKIDDGIIRYRAPTLDVEVEE